jgi:endoglucanase
MNRRSVLRFAGIAAVAASIAEISDRSAFSGAITSSAPDDESQPIDPFAFNQVGFLPHAEKVATVKLREAADLSFQILTEAGAGGSSEQAAQPVFRGKLAAPILDAASGDRVMLADFSAWTKTGRYCLETQGKRSQPFSLGEDAYRHPLRLSMRAFYGQRCGCAVDLGGGYRHAACHMSGAYHSSSGREGAVQNHGGWHDAGDYGRYVVNSGITTGTLLWAWELYPQVLHSLSLDIPDSSSLYGVRLPDYLAEVRWNLEWMLSLQDEDGGVWHKQTSEQFCAFILPERDDLTSYVIGTGASPFKSTCATADLAAVMAIAARCYAAYDAAFSARCLDAAKRGWIWANAHPDVIFTNPQGVATGGYGDAHCQDEMLWASAELWRTTGESQFDRAFQNGIAALPPETAITAPSWANVAPMAYWTYALAERKGSGNLRGRVLKETAITAQALVARRASSGYGNTMASSDYIWGSNSVAANQSLLLLMAHHFQPDRQVLEAALGNLHYLLGRNCFGVSWVTQVGTNPFQRPHHRPSAADAIPAPWPGLLSGGPNARPADEVARTLAKLPPMRMWIDDAKAYSLNEVAINWNAPLVFLLAGATAQAT